MPVMPEKYQPSDYRALAAYYTPPKLAKAIVSLLSFGDGTVFFEPSVGGGAFVDAIRWRAEQLGVSVWIIGLDINPDAPGLAKCSQRIVADYLADDWITQLPPVDVIIGNPPFSDPTATTADAKKRKRPKPVATRHVERGIDLLKPGGHQLLVLRSTWNEAENVAGGLLLRHPMRVVAPPVPRPSFGQLDKETGLPSYEGGNDLAGTCVHWWTKGYEGPCDHAWLHWNKPWGFTTQVGHFGNRAVGGGHG